jgi:chaperonin GroEL
MFPAKKIIYNTDARSKILDGMNIISDAVKVTLGPRGRNVILEQDGGYPYMTKDGVTVAREIRIKDPERNIGVEIIREVASKTGILAGDGTTTSCVIAQYVAQEGIKLMNAGFHPGELKKGMDLAVKAVCQYVTDVALPVSNSDAIRRVAMIASNDDAGISDILVKAYEAVGHDGVITIEEGYGLGLELELLEGMQLDSGLSSTHHLFMNDAEKGVCKFDDVWVVIHEKPLVNLLFIKDLLTKLLGEGKPILILSEKIADQALAMLIKNKMEGVPFCGVALPYQGARRKTIQQDLAVFTGAKVINQDHGILQKSFTPDMMGKAERIIVSNDKTIIIKGNAKAEELTKRVNDIRDLLKQEDCPEHEKLFLNLRLGSLTNGVAVIKVGAASKMELRERLDRVDDALCSTKAALKEGVVAGGGVTLLRAVSNIRSIDYENDSQRKGAEIIANAMSAPLRQILINCGIETPSLIINDVANSQHPSWGYDARKEVMCDMIASGVIDAAKVVKTSLIDAVSAASMVLSTEAVVIYERKEDK